ncbi:MAG TPA: hypothetical protein PKC76_07855 [Saprospiraceae bacterium]|nr:hypothetical protein [Saprospiraceae bacterium]HMP24028.1 hypothetical protein [Saprospiraceae bacterium]
MSRFLCVFLPALVVALGQVHAQNAIDWGVLADVKFEKKYSDKWAMDYDEATFGKLPLLYAGEEVSISGYIIPIDALGLSYVLSRNPNATCFFCGGAGPETVIELRFKPEAMKRYRMDERRTFKGILQLNRENIKQFTYVLLQAEPG